MPALLVSVRSAAEALAARAGGAAVIDVKEPARGPLGRADVDVWREIFAAIPPVVPVSVALGELSEWRDGPFGRSRPDSDGLDPAGLVPSRGLRSVTSPASLRVPLAACPPVLRDGRGTGGQAASGTRSPASPGIEAAPQARFPRPADFAGLAYRKLGLAHAGPDWAEAWARLRRALGDGPPWVAVIYAEGPAVGAPPPDDVLDVALAASDCAGVLVDTWDKSRPSPLDESWAPRVRRAQAAGRFVALAGGLDEPAIARLAPLGPDLFAVRGAACGSGDRRGTIDPARVARLARAAGRDEFAKIEPSRRPGSELS